MSGEGRTIGLRCQDPVVGDPNIGEAARSRWLEEDLCCGVALMAVEVTMLASAVLGPASTSSSTLTGGTTGPGLLPLPLDRSRRKSVLWVVAGYFTTPNLFSICL